jgi:membrane associated rhomboid family serine protease
VNVGVWLLSMASGERSTLFDFGANGQVIDAGGEWYRIVTSAFLHWGVVHLALNMLALWNIGPAVERALGWQRFGLVYASALLAGSAGALLLDPNAITAGASGAIYGLLGALVILYRRAGINVWRSGLGLTLALNFFITVTIPNVSLGGHLGGLVGGLLSTYLLVELPRRVSSPKLPLALAVAAVPALAGVALLAASTWQNPLFN